MWRTSPIKRSRGRLMLHFFHGWRRKVGVVALVMACGLASEWIRSQSSGDTLLFHGRRQVHGIGSSRGELSWTTNWLTDGSNRPVFSRITWSSYPILPRSAGFTPIEDQIDHWRLSGYGFEFYKCHWTGSKQSAVVCTFPYWAITIPITVVSACLLVSKPRPKPTQP